MVLLAGSVALALYLARHYHLGVPSTVVTTVLGGGAPASLYLTWAGYRNSRRDAAGKKGLAEVVDDLADAVRRQWDEEARVRRLYDPYPLPVSWEPADASLVDPWNVLVKQASNVGRPLSAKETKAWASGPAQLAGTDSDLSKVLLRVPTRRLVVLGGPGAGKTMLMVRLLRDLLASRASGDPVPVLLPLASWNPAETDLRTWLTDQLTIDYPALAAEVPSGTGDTPLSAALLDAGLVLPILDGLDEIADSVRGQAIAKINDSLLPGSQLVVTCRTAHYREAIGASDGVRLTLRAAAGVELRALDAEAVAAFLQDDAGLQAEERWSPVLTVLGTQAPAGLALTTPLMVALARTIYNPRQGEHAQKLPDPAELCALADQDAVEEHLFDAFIHAAYRDRGDGRWTAPQAEKWLTFLARHLERTVGSPDLAWWQLPEAAPAASFEVLFMALSTGAGLGAPAGFGAWWLVGHVLGLPSAASWAGFLVGGMIMFASVLVASRYVVSFSRSHSPSSGLSFDFDEVPFGLRFGAGGFVVGMLYAGLRLGIRAGLKAEARGGVEAGIRAGIAAAYRAGLPAAVAFGLIALVLGLFMMFEPEPGDLAAAVSPRAVLARDRRAVLIPVLVLAVLLGLTTWLTIDLLPGAGRTLGLGPDLGAGLGFGLGVFTGLLVIGHEAAWLDYDLARGWLALRRRLPWALMSFLADAHQRGVLRQAGAVYQFRHIELQRRLASRGTGTGKDPAAG